MLLGISELFDKIDKQSDVETQKKLLADLQNNRVALNMLKIALDPEVKYHLPEGDPPYKPCILPDQHSALYTGMRQFYIYIGPKNESIKQSRREEMFIRMLESLHPQDAKLVLASKSKTFNLLYPNITYDLVKSVYPMMLPDKNSNVEVEVKSKPITTKSTKLIAKPKTKVKPKKKRAVKPKSIVKE